MAGPHTSSVSPSSDAAPDAKSATSGHPAPHSYKEGRPITARDVRYARSMLRLSQQRFAVLLRLSTVTISRWEMGHTMPAGYGAVVLQMLLRLPIKKIGVDVVIQKLQAAKDRGGIISCMVRLVDQHAKAA